jgi:hypothetical protein
MRKTLKVHPNLIDINYGNLSRVVIVKTEDLLDGHITIVSLTLSQAETLQLMLGDAIEELKPKDVLDTPIPKDIADRVTKRFNEIDERYDKLFLEWISRDVEFVVDSSSKEDVWGFEFEHQDKLHFISDTKALRAYWEEYLAPVNKD